MKLDDPIDLSKYLAEGRRVRNRIHRIGIELEGFWQALPKGVRLTRDGSLDPFAARLVQERKLTASPLVGELPSPPLSLSEKDDVIYWRTWLQKHYASEVAPECGMHVHVSFIHAFTYQRLMKSSFVSTTIKYMKEWATKQGFTADHPIWPRLEGKSRYCQHKFFPDAQAAIASKEFDQTREGHRYTVWNFCYTRNHTAECRLLPMFAKVEEAESAIDHLIAIINAFLVATAAKEPKIEKRFILTGNTLVTRNEKDRRVVVDTPEFYREVRHVVT